MQYSEALEKQLGLLRYLQSDKGQVVLRMSIGTWYEDALPEERPAPTDEILDALYEALGASEPFFWAKPICEVMEQTAPDLPDWTPVEDQLPVRDGFHWFETPLVLPHEREDADSERPFEDEDWDEDEADAALSAEERQQAEADRVASEKAFADRMYRLQAVCWSVRGDALAVYYFMRSHEAIAPAGAMAHCLMHVPFGVPLSDGQTKATSLSLFGDAERFDRELRYLGAMLAFLSQTVFVTRRQQVDRATRRRNVAKLAELKREPYVEVVELRRREYDRTASAEHREVEWTCQWIVRGHWRQQWHPALGRHQPRWIPPYVKGPEDKPLRPPRAKLFAVIR